MAELLKYFAYGSNLHPLRLKARTPSCQTLAVTYLAGYKLCFHKRGRDGSGKCNAWFTGNSADRVMGAVYTLAPNEKQRLDQAESLGQGYNQVTLRLAIGDDTHIIFFYVADLSFIDESLKPFTWYKALVMTGCRAHRLPDAYVQQVARVTALPDPSRARAYMHLRILTNSID